MNCTFAPRRGPSQRYVGVVRNFGASTVILNGVALPFVAGSTVPQTGIETRTVSLGVLHHF